VAYAAVLGVFRRQLNFLAQSKIAPSAVARDGHDQARGRVIFLTALAKELIVERERWMHSPNARC